jgi:hypothetical protein
MKLKFKLNSGGEGFGDLDVPEVKAIRMAVNLVLFNDEKPEYRLEDDGSLILEIREITQETREAVVGAVTAICWGDITFEDLGD